MSGFVVPAEGGATFTWSDGHWVMKVTSDDTDGDLAVMELTCPAGLATPEHTHPTEDEVFYLIEGSIDGFCGDDQWSAETGGLVFLPRSVPHGFSVTSDRPARMLVILGGRVGLDRHVAEMGTPA